MQPNQNPLARLAFRRYLDRLVASRTGRAHILNQAAFAEDSDEGQVFDVLLAQIDDADLQKMVRIHAADERRHAEMFRDALARNGFEPWAVPPELSLIERLDVALGGFFDGFLDREHPVMDAYLLLQVIEERAVTQFETMRPAFAAHDPQTAELLDSIAADEARHLKYCVAIARRYAPDPQTAAARLAELRAVESRVYAELSRANMRHTIAKDMLAVGPIEKRLWRGVLRLLERADRPMVTPFAQAQAAAR
jgi:rubrerythrin